jgi:hypothetical protein
MGQAFLWFASHPRRISTSATVADFFVQNKIRRIFILGTCTTRSVIAAIVSTVDKSALVVGVASP